MEISVEDSYFSDCFSVDYRMEIQLKKSEGYASSLIWSHSAS